MILSLCGNVSTDFYGDLHSPKKSAKPDNLSDALFSFLSDLTPGKKEDLLLTISPAIGPESALFVLGHNDILFFKCWEMIEKTDTWDPSIPAEVWIDEGGYYTVTVF